MNLLSRIRHYKTPLPVVTLKKGINGEFTVGGKFTLATAKFTDYCSIQRANYRDVPGGAGDADVSDILTPAAAGVNSSCVVKSVVVIGC